MMAANIVAPGGNRSLAVINIETEDYIDGKLSEKQSILSMGKDHPRLRVLMKHLLWPRFQEAEVHR